MNQLFKEVREVKEPMLNRLQVGVIMLLEKLGPMMEKEDAILENRIVKVL